MSLCHSLVSLCLSQSCVSLPCPKDVSQSLSGCLVSLLCLSCVSLVSLCHSQGVLCLSASQVQKIELRVLTLATR